MNPESAEKSSQVTASSITHSAAEVRLRTLDDSGVEMIVGYHGGIALHLHDALRTRMSVLDVWYECIDCWQSEEFLEFSVHVILNQHLMHEVLVCGARPGFHYVPDVGQQEVATATQRAAAVAVVNKTSRWPTDAGSMTNEEMSGRFEPERLHTGAHTDTPSGSPK